MRELKRPQEAEEAYRKALAENPNNPDTLDNLALAVKDLERTDDAIALLQRALTIEPRVAKFHLHLAGMLLDKSRVDEAKAALEQALALKNDDHDAINLMGRVAFEHGQLDEALAHYRRALALKRDLPDAWNNMGNALKELGRLDEARAAYLEALALDPGNTGIYVNFADSKTFAADDPHLAAMQALARQDNLSPTERMQINFALGKAYADLKEHNRSFEHLIEANARKRAQTAYDEAATLALFERIEQTFTPALIARKARDGDPSELPIFVLGMPRSGTTLVEQILASHPQVHGAGELKVLRDIADTVQGVGAGHIPYPEFVPALDPAGMREVGARYLAALRKLAPGRAPRDRQDAVEFLLRRAHSSGAAERADHPHRARSGRHLRVVLLQAVHRRAEPHLRPRRARPLSPALPAPDGALASRAAGRPDPRRPL